MKKLFILAAISAAMGVSAPAALDTAKIDQITGLKGKFNEKEGVYKVTLPRDDVKVVVDGWAMPISPKFSSCTSKAKARSRS